MARAPRRAALRRALLTRRTGWMLAAALALLGLLLGAQRLGWHRLTRAAGLLGHALAQAARLALDAGWLLLLLAAVGLALGLVLSSRRGRRPEREQGFLRPRWLPPWLWQRRWWIALATLFILVWWLLPPLLYRHTGTVKDAKLKAITDTRTALLAGLIGVGALMTFWLNNRVYRITVRTLQVTEQGQITERYTKAVDQLGSTHPDVCLGGIYALERIARDSKRDRATIEEVLTAYIRSHAPWPPPPATPTPEASTQQPTTPATPPPLATASPVAETVVAGSGTAGQPDEKVAEPQGPAAGVQAAVTVLGRRKLPPDGLRRLDLTGVDLRRAQLARANLQGAQLARANLQDAYLGGANLQGAQLWEAHLEGAQLGGANLQGAQLWEVHLEGAYLGGANLQGAMNPGGAYLEGAIANEHTRWPEGWTFEAAMARGVRGPVRFQKRSD